MELAATGGVFMSNRFSMFLDMVLAAPAQAKENSILATAKGIELGNPAACDGRSMARPQIVPGSDTCGLPARSIALSIGRSALAWWSS